MLPNSRMRDGSTSKKASKGAIIRKSAPPDGNRTASKDGSHNVSNPESRFNAVFDISSD